MNHTVNAPVTFRSKDAPTLRTNTGVLISPSPDQESWETYKGRARIQQHGDSSCHQDFFPAKQGAEGNSRHSDRNISLFPSWSG